ncbi:MAG: hypothetical protein AAF721_14390 [Myxococcota bacterium]
MGLRDSLAAYVLAGIAAAAPGCAADADDDGADTANSGSDTTAAASSSDTSDTDPSPATEGPTSGNATDGSGDATAGSSDESGGATWQDVVCGSETCVGGDACIQPGLDCDYGPCGQGEEAQWVTPAPYCVPLPVGCSPTAAAGCLAAEHCVDDLDAQFDAGLLECAPAALYCFCF